MRLFQTYVNAIVPLFYRPVFEVIALSAYIAAVLHTKLVAVQGAYHIAQRIYKTLRHYTAGMRTFIRKCKQLLLVPPNAYVFLVYQHHRYVIGGKGKIGFKIGYFKPLVFFCWHKAGFTNKNILICRGSAPGIAGALCLKW